MIIRRRPFRPHRQDATHLTSPLSQGYWNGHPAEWPISSMVLGAQIYSKKELRTILAGSTSR